MSNFFKLNKHVHVNKDKIKASFDITVKKISHLDEYNGKPVNLSWKRGKRPTNAGMLKDVVVSNGEASWDEKVVVQVTLFKDIGVDKFDEKSLALQLSQGHKPIGKLRLDLGTLAKSDGSSTLEFSFEKKKNYTPSLHIVVQAKWLKLNDRLLVRLDDGPGADHHANGIKPTTVEIDGHGYNLRTDDALTEPSMDTTSGSWDDHEEEEEAKEHYGNHEHDPFASASVFEAETRKVQDELDSIKKQLRLVEGQSSERAKTIELQEKEILALRQKLLDSEDMVQRAVNMEGFMDQQLALLRQEHEEALKQQKNNHSKELEAEVDRHREELETALTRAQLCLLSPSLPHTNASPQEVETIKQEKDDLVRQRDNLQEKVQLVTRELEESAKSLVAFDERISKKDKKIARLKDEIQSLYLSLNNVTESNQVLKEKSRGLKLRASQDTSDRLDSSDSRPVSRPSKPLFNNPLLDKYWGLIYLATFGFVLVIHHMITMSFGHTEDNQ